MISYQCIDKKSSRSAAGAQGPNPWESESKDSPPSGGLDATRAPVGGQHTASPDHRVRSTRGEGADRTSWLRAIIRAKPKCAPGLLRYAHEALSRTTRLLLVLFITVLTLADTGLAALAPLDNGTHAINGIHTHDAPLHVCCGSGYRTEIARHDAMARDRSHHSTSPPVHAHHSCRILTSTYTTTSGNTSGAILPTHCINTRVQDTERQSDLHKSYVPYCGRITIYGLR